VNFRVIERRYALFPQQSGLLTIEPVVFNGQIAQVSSRFPGNPLMQNTRSKRLRSEPLTINVSPKPLMPSSQLWLPARNITLTETWDDSPPVFKVGEAVTRTLTLTADGLMAAQLPEINVTLPEALKYYSDQAVVNDQKTGAGVIGSRQQKIAIIPAHEGQFTLPEIKLEWWNTQKRQSEILRLPQRTIQVMPADGVTAGAAADQQSAAAAVGDATLDNESDHAAPASLAGNYAAAYFWPGLSLVLLCGWLTTFLIMRTRRSVVTSDAAVGQHPDIVLSRKKVLSRLRQACLSNDAIATKETLLDWGKAHFTTDRVTSLAVIANLTNAGVAGQIETLNRTLYSKNSNDWTGQDLWQAIDLYSRSNDSSKNNKGKQVLAPLYP
jgi:hypothetical protein